MAAKKGTPAQQYQRARNVLTDRGYEAARAVGLAKATPAMKRAQAEAKATGVGFVKRSKKG